MATYRGKQYLEQQLDTILAQTVPVRILISDDGSDDGTREMLENYAGWYPEQVFLHHRTQHTGGAAGNFFVLMQEALKKEKNEYIFFSDQDDVWENNKVSVMLHRMKVLEKGLGKQCPILLYSDMEVVDEDLYEISPSFAAYTHQDPDRSSFAELLVENQVTGGASMINRALLTHCAMEPEICCMHDWWIALIASAFGRIIYLDEPLLLYRQHTGNVVGGSSRSHYITNRVKHLTAQRQVLYDTCKQAEVFLTIYNDQLTETQKRLVSLFAGLPSANWFTRRYLILRYHFLKSGLLRNLGVLLII